MDLKLLKNFIEKTASQLAPELIQIRRHLHQYPELGRQEWATTAYLMKLLQPLNLHILSAKGETGLWADLCLAPDRPLLALRADIDALPLQELTGVEYASKNAGVMHACGHDAHTTILVGSALVLSKLQKSLPINVRFIFQPAEEVTPGGAIDIIRRGALEQAAAIVGFHVCPRLATGSIAIKFGPFLASNDVFTFRIMGKGGHAASPYKTIDPILVASQIINTLYQTVPRGFPATSPHVITITKINGGTTINVIPNVVEVSGTIRAFDQAVRKKLKKRLRQIIGDICRIHHARFELHIEDGAPPVINDPALSQLVCDAAGQMLGADHVFKIEEPEMGSEDFSWYQQYAPGMMFALGTNGHPGTSYELHHPKFNLDERAILIGVKTVCWTVINYFSQA